MHIQQNLEDDIVKEALNKVKQLADRESLFLFSFEVLLFKYFR